MFQIEKVKENSGENKPYFWRRSELIIIGVVNIILFLSTIAYMAFFFWTGSNIHNLNLGPVSGMILNTFLILLFTVPHSLFLTSKWKRRFSKIVPGNMFITLYTLYSTFTLLLMFLFWTPSTGYFYSLEGGYALIMRVLYLLSWAYLGWSMMETGALSQNGIKDWWDTLKENKTTRENSFSGPYKYHRHPIYISFLGIIWFLPHMSWDRLYIALFWTVYTLIGATLKERRLGRNRAYQNYLNTVVPFPGFPRLPLVNLWSKIAKNIQEVLMKFMKSFSATLLVLILILPFSIRSETISQFYRFDNFDQAEGASNYIKFTVESTKIGIFSSDVPGFAKRFFLKTDFDFKKNESKNMIAEFKILDLDTDNSSRDEKLWNFCLDEKKHKKIKVMIVEPYKLSSGEKMVKGKIFIRGVEREIDISLKIERKKNIIIVKGKSLTTLSSLKIPDPSIAIAKLSDDIKIDFKFLLMK